MIGYRNERAEAAGNSSSNRQYLYNFVVRLLLERVTAFVRDDAEINGVEQPLLRIIMASRRGHHFGHFKAYVLQLIRQAKAESTFLNTREVDPDILKYSLIERMPASQHPGLQLADIVVSSVFQSIEQSSPAYSEKPAEFLRSIIAGKPRWKDGRSFKNNVGLTIYPANQAMDLINKDQEAFFTKFDYDFEWLRQNRKK